MIVRHLNRLNIVVRQVRKGIVTKIIVKLMMIVTQMIIVTSETISVFVQDLQLLQVK